MGCHPVAVVIMHGHKYAALLIGAKSLSSKSLSVKL